MKILIATPYYRLDRKSASQRWSNLAVGLLDAGHEIFVATCPVDESEKESLAYDEDGIHVARICQKTVFESLFMRSRRGGGKKSESVFTKIGNMMLIGSMRFKARGYAREIKKLFFADESTPDVIISSSCPVFETLVGSELKKLFGCRWIADFRVMPGGAGGSDLNGRMNSLLQKLLTGCDALTAASAGVAKIASERFGVPESKIAVIPDGYCAGRRESQDTPRDSVLHIAHTGSLHGGLRRADMLFKALNIVKEIDPRARFSLECAGDDNSSLGGTAARYGISEIVHDHGELSREDSLALQNSADVLLLLVYDRHGAVAGKLFDYIACRKPIVCICGGSGISEESKIVRDLNLGLDVGESDGEKATEILAGWLLSQYRKKLSGVPLSFSPDTVALGNYSLEASVARFEELCRGGAVS
ncbi:MAG: hypothetical protein J5919_07850 [Clostridia bacterium]|nr:hypothetical protein [Clostridia bacterium]